MFADLGLSRGGAARHRRHGLPPSDADPGAGDPLRPDGPRRDGHGADRHRQDRRLHPADAGHPVRLPRPRPHAAQPDPGADARTRAAGRREFRPVRQVPEADPRPDHRRREHVRPEGRAEPRRRCADRHARPAARHVRPRHHPAVRHQAAGDRRSRPDAGHGLHPRCRADRLDAADDPADAVLLRDHGAGNPPPGRCVPDQPEGNRGLARGLGRHDDHRRPGAGRRTRQARGAAAADPQPERAERADLLQPQARRRYPAQVADQAPFRCRRAAWRHGADGAVLDAGEVQGQRAAAAGVQRRGGARPRHRRPVACVQLRRADPCRGLCPSHRPHRARRAGRPGLHHRRAGRPLCGGADREADRPSDPADHGRGPRSGRLGREGRPQAARPQGGGAEESRREGKAARGQGKD